MTKREIAHILKEISFFLLLKGENPFRARAYEQAGVALLVCPEELDALVQEGLLTRVKGIGTATASQAGGRISIGLPLPPLPPLPRLPSIVIGRPAPPRVVYDSPRYQDYYDYGYAPAPCPPPVVYQAPRVYIPAPSFSFGIDLGGRGYRDYGYRGYSSYGYRNYGHRDYGHRDYRHDDHRGHRR